MDLVLISEPLNNIVSDNQAIYQQYTILMDLL
jgi:hypothetical protein